MTQKELYDKYIKEQCKNCLNKDKDLCDIRIIQNLDGTIITKCEYYIRNKENIKSSKENLKRYREKFIYRTAKYEPCVMQGLISDWSKL